MFIELLKASYNKKKSTIIVLPQMLNPKNRLTSIQYLLNIIVIPIGSIEHSPTIFSVPGYWTMITLRGRLVQ